MHTHPKVAAVASQNWPFRHDAKCEPLLKFLKANIHEASSHAYPLNLPTRVREDPKKKTPRLSGESVLRIAFDDLVEEFARDHERDAALT